MPIHRRQAFAVRSQQYNRSGALPEARVLQELADLRQQSEAGPQAKSLQYKHVSFRLQLVDNYFGSLLGQGAQVGPLGPLVPLAVGTFLPRNAR